MEKIKKVFSDRPLGIVILVVLLAIIIVLFASPRIAINHDGVIKSIQSELQLSDKYSITYVGEFKKDDDSLLWFITECPTGNLYTVVECKLLPGNSYYFKKIITPKTYARDIVSLVWNTEYFYLINNTQCRTIALRNRHGEITSRINISSTDYPYLYHHTIDTARTISFLDEDGNGIL